MPALQVMCRHGSQQVHVIVPLACKYGRFAVTGGRKIRRSDCFFALPLLFFRTTVAATIVLPFTMVDTKAGAVDTLCRLDYQIGTRKSAECRQIAQKIIVVAIHAV